MKPKEAFNKFNVPEILSQLMTALHAAGMDETIKKLNQMGITRLVNDAWANRSMVDRLVGRYAMQKQAEAHDCWQDYKGGGMTYAELQECIEHFERLERGDYRHDYAAEAKWYTNWAEIADLKGNESDAKFIRSVAEYVRRRSAPSPKQGEVLDRIRKRYVEELKNPVATLQRLESEKELREKEEAEAQLNFDKALRELGGHQDHTKWNHWHSGQGEPEYPGYYYTDEGRPFFAQIEYNGWRGWRLTKLEIKEKNRNGRTLYTRTLSGGPDKLDDAMALATGMIRKFEAGEDPTKPPSAMRPPAPVQVGHKPRVDMQFDAKAVEALEALATRTGNGMLKGMVALIKGGKNLTEDQLKAIRAQFHRTGQHGQAELFRPKTAFLGLFEDQEQPVWGPDPSGRNWKFKNSVVDGSRMWLWRNPSHADLGMFMVRRSELSGLFHLSWLDKRGNRAAKFPNEASHPSKLFPVATKIFPDLQRLGEKAFQRWVKDPTEVIQ